jgi:hypothetical protein
MAKLDEAVEANRIAWESPWPRAARKCAAGLKNYADSDSDPAEDHEAKRICLAANRANDLIQTQDRKKLRYAHDSDSDTDDDVIVVEERSTPAPEIRGLALRNAQPKPKTKIARLPLDRSAQRKLRAGRLFKSLPTEACYFFIYHPSHFIS